VVSRHSQNITRMLTLLAGLLMSGVLAGAADAQEFVGPPIPGSVGARVEGVVSSSAGSLLDLGAGEGGGFNPLAALDAAGSLLSARGAQGDQGQQTGPQSGDDGQRPTGLSAAMNIMVVLTVISLAPSIMLMTTCFVRILIVLGLLRQALGTQSMPPGQVITALALFMTMMVMAPTFDRVWNEAVIPYRAGEVTDYEDLWMRARQPVRDFMFDQIEATGGWSSLYMVLEYRGVDVSEPQNLRRSDVDTVSLIPAFMLSELKTAFLMGFRIYLPFLVIDMVIASLLISMSMMMLPPVLISLPFKLLLFVMVDGWTLVVGSLLTSFSTGVPAPG